MPGVQYASRVEGPARVVLLGVALAWGLAARAAAAPTPSEEPPSARSAARADTLALQAGGRAGQADTLQADSLGAQLVPMLRIRGPFPHGVRIRSLQDNRLRRIYVPLGLLVPLAPVDSTPGPAPRARPPVPAADLSALEVRLRNRLEARLEELESAQQDSLRALALRLEGETATALAASGERGARPGPRVLVVPQSGTTGAEGQSVERREGTGAVESGGTALVPVPIPLGLGGPDSTAAAGADTLASLAAGTDSLVSAPAPPPTIVEIERAVLDVGLLRSVNVVFEVNQTALLAPSFPVLDAMGNVLGRYPDVRLEINGHTDSAGSEEHNLQLSQARAEAVRTYLLTTFSLDPSRLTAVGYGEGRPIASNDHATGRTLNRRVEFAVLGRTVPN